MRRGEIRVCDFDPNRGGGVWKRRPGLIIQADWLSQAQSHTVVVLPLTAQVEPQAEGVRVTVHARERLLKDSQALVAQPQTLPRSRISGEVLGRWTDGERDRIEQALRAILLM